MSEHSTDGVEHEGIRCGKCGEKHSFVRVRNGQSPAVSEVEVLECPNGHRGKINFGPDGNLSQTHNVKGVGPNA